MSQRPLKRILLVEDDPDIQVIARLALEEVGKFEVTVCGTGEEALRAVPAASPDLILLDVTMPDLDGPATLGELRKRAETFQTPVVFLTANTQTMDLSRYLRLGAEDIIRKPFDPMTLPETVRHIWERSNG